MPRNTTSLKLATAKYQDHKEPMFSQFLSYNSITYLARLGFAERG